MGVHDYEDPIGCCLFKFSINQIIAAKVVVILYGTLVSPYLFINSDNVFLKYSFVVIISIVVTSDYRMFYLIYSQGLIYRLTSIIFLSLIPVSFLVGINWEYRIYMILVILLFGFHVYMLDYSFMQKRRSDR